MQRIIIAILGAALLLVVSGLTHAQQKQQTGRTQGVEALERISVDKRSTRQSIDLGRAYYAAGRLDDALTAVNAAIKLDSDAADAWRIKGDVARERGDQPGALRAYERAIRSDPRRAEFELLRGQALMELGREREADQAFARYQSLQQVQVVPASDQN